MKLKYYLRGLGIGIIATTIILMICFSQEETTISDEAVIERAKALGMIMPSETEEATETEELDDSQKMDMTSRNEVNHTGQAGREDTKPPASSGAEAEDRSESAGDTPSETEGNQPSESLQPDTPEDTDAPASGVYSLFIRQGDVCRTVCDTLMENGVVSDSESLRQYLSEIGYASQMATGRYDIPYGMTMEEVAQVLANGPVVRMD